MKKGNISVIIPTYKGAGQINRAVDSVIKQTYKNFDIYVVDDNDPSSIDRKQTADAVSKYLIMENFHYIQHEKNKNGAAARNTGLKLADGEFITFLDDDDYLLKERFQIAVQELNANEKISIVFFNVKKTDNSKKEIVISAPSEISNISLLLDAGMMGTGSNLFMRREVFLGNGFFDERYIRYQDVEYMSRALAKYKAIWVDQIMIVKSVNGVNNRPDIFKLYQMQQYLHEDMNTKMGEISPDIKKKIIERHASSLFMKAMSGNCSKEEVIFAKKNLQKIRKMLNKERLCYSLYKVSPYLYKKIRKVFNLMKK